MIRRNSEFTVEPALHENIKLRMGLAGGPKTGKTRGALELATYLAKRDGSEPSKTIVVIDAENRSSLRLTKTSKQREGEFDFQVIHLTPPYSPERYIAAIHAAIEAGAEYVIVDGISQEWNGTGGSLERVDKVAASSKSGNSYTAWGEVTPAHNRFIDAIIHCPVHIICTMRGKVQRVIEAGAVDRAFEIDHITCHG